MAKGRKKGECIKTYIARPDGTVWTQTKFKCTKLNPSKHYKKEYLPSLDSSKAVPAAPSSLKERFANLFKSKPSAPAAIIPPTPVTGGKNNKNKTRKKNIIGKKSSRKNKKNNKEFK